MNRPTIQPTEFKNYPQGNSTFGVRVYDDEGQAYDNTWDSIPNDDLEIIRRVRQANDETMNGILDYCRENQIGIYVGEKWYPYDEIVDLLVD